MVVFFFKQKTAYEMRISDWSSDVCSSDREPCKHLTCPVDRSHTSDGGMVFDAPPCGAVAGARKRKVAGVGDYSDAGSKPASVGKLVCGVHSVEGRSEEHTSELQSLMRISYAVFCLQKKTYKQTSKKIQ